MFAQLSLQNLLTQFHLHLTKKKHKLNDFPSIKMVGTQQFNLTIFSVGTQISSDQIQFQSTLKIIITTCGNKEKKM